MNREELKKVIIANVQAIPFLQFKKVYEAWACLYRKLKEEYGIDLEERVNAENKPKIDLLTEQELIIAVKESTELLKKATYSYKMRLKNGGRK